MFNPTFEGKVPMISGEPQVWSYLNQVREAFENKNDETYGIFHMLVDPPPLPKYGKFFRDFLLSKKDF